jgi:hypothetical protein
VAKKKAARKPKPPAPPAEGKFRMRIRELRFVPAGELVANPRNWRTHPDEQRTALRAALEEIGWAGTVLCRELPAGALEIIDGHLRADIDPAEIVPCLVTDLSGAEADKLLAVFDPIGDLAGADPAKLRELLDAVHFDSQDLTNLVAELAEEHGVLAAAAEEEAGGGASDAPIPETYQLVIDCRDQADQAALAGEFEERGYECRVLTL